MGHIDISYWNPVSCCKRNGDLKHLIVQTAEYKGTTQSNKLENNFLSNETFDKSQALSPTKF